MDAGAITRDLDKFSGLEEKMDEKQKTGMDEFATAVGDLDRPRAESSPARSADQGQESVTQVSDATKHRPSGNQESPSESRNRTGPDSLSLAEQITREMGYDEKLGDRKIPDSDDQIQLSELQKMSMSDLLAAAEKAELGDLSGVKRQDLIFRILKNLVKTSGLMFGEGTLEILPDGFGFLRSPDYHYLSCPDDIYVSPSQIRRFNLRTGVTVAGQIRPPKENERYFALLRVESVNQSDPSENVARVHFDDLTPLHPNRRVVMEYDSEEYSTRIVDMITPIGFGQRGLIVSPPRAGKTVLLQQMARAVLHNYPDAYVIMLLIDERPEEVTDMEREVIGSNCEVVSSTFDESPGRHIHVSDMVIEKAKRMVECGMDVVIFMDSITRLARAWNTECISSGKVLSGGLDANALQNPKRFFGSARKVEEGGSLTILATALVDTGSKMDEVIYEEFKGTGNLEIVLDRKIVERRIFPAIDVNASGTRREEILLDPEEHKRISMTRRVLAECNAVEAMDMLVKKVAATKSNAEFLMSVNPES